MTINIKGYDVLIDDEDYELIKGFKWSADSRPEKDAVYFKCYAGGGKKHPKHIYLHRLIAGAREAREEIIKQMGIPLKKEIEESLSRVNKMIDELFENMIFSMKKLKKGETKK